MVKMYYDNDANLFLLFGNFFFFIGYGYQGMANQVLLWAMVLKAMHMHRTCRRAA